MEFPTGSTNLTSRIQLPLNQSDLWLFIEENIGSQRQPLSVAIPLTIFNGAIFITGVTGNLAVCIVIKQNSTLHSAIHYFLFNLAVADILLLVFGLPNDVSLHWHQYPWDLGLFFCKFRGLISEMSSYVSVMTMVVFSTERYLAICHPLRMHALSGFSRAIKIIGLLWLIGFIAALPFFYYMDVHYLYYRINSTESVRIEESALCALMRLPEKFPLLETSFGLFFVVPLITIIIQYIKMSSSILRSEPPLNGFGGSMNNNRIRGRAQSNRSVVRLLRKLNNFLHGEVTSDAEICMPFNTRVKLNLLRMKKKVFTDVRKNDGIIISVINPFVEMYILTTFRQTGTTRIVPASEDHLRMPNEILAKRLSVVVGFFICWAPFHAQRLMVIYASDWEHIIMFNYWMFWTTGVLYYFSATLNPILYNLMSRKMRSAFRQTFGRFCSKQVITRNSDLSSSTIQERLSRNFRDENQLLSSTKNSVRRGSKGEKGIRKKIMNIENHGESIV